MSFRAPLTLRAYDALPLHPFWTGIAFTADEEAQALLLVVGTAAIGDQSSRPLCEAPRHAVAAQGLEQTVVLGQQREQVTRRLPEDHDLERGYDDNDRQQVAHAADGIVK